MRNKFISFLESNGFYPYTQWDYFGIEHDDGKSHENTYASIKEKFGDKKGLYIYTKGDRILYIGKANSLFGRIKSHYQESFKEVSGDTKWHTWHKFFSDDQNKGTLRIYWKELNNEFERQIIEKMLIYTLSPEFETKRKETEKE
jgi:excinuclease UvrABC nuclease subunit